MNLGQKIGRMLRIDNPERSWSASLPEPERKAILNIANEVASRLANPEILAKAIADSKRQAERPEYMRWQPHDIAQGDAGLALMFGQMDLCFPHQGWDRHAYNSLKQAENLQFYEMGLGIFSGLSGLGYMAFCLSKNGTRYQKMSPAIDSSLLSLLDNNARNYSVSFDYTDVSVWDVISGFSGEARYLIAKKEFPGVRPVLENVLRALIATTRDVKGLPRWFTPPELAPGEHMRATYPSGNLNCGLAHGIPGPLSALSLAKTHGIEVEGQEVAIRKIADWLLAHRTDDKYGMNWPSAVSIKNIGTKDSPRYLQTTEGLIPSHTGWCYGLSGVAVSLWNAGTALNDKNYREKAIEIMRSVFARPMVERMMVNPGLCHGFAGQMQISMRFAHNTGLPAFRENACQILQFLLKKYYNPDTLLEFQSRDAGPNPIDNPGMLDGAPGVILALLAASTNVEPTWDHIFMLS